MLDLGSSASRHAGSTPVIRTNKNRTFVYQTEVLFLFIQAAGLVYHRRTKYGVYHHAPACIFLRLDDIQGFALIHWRKYDITFSKGVIREANYGQSEADMLSKFEIALKECSETEDWLQLLYNTNGIDEMSYKNHRNLCGRIRRMLIASCKTMKENIK